MTAVTYLQRIQELLAELTDRRDQIEHAAGVCTDCIAAENVVHVFVGSPPPSTCRRSAGRWPSYLRARFRECRSAPLSSYVMIEFGLGVFLQEVFLESLRARRPDLPLIFEHLPFDHIPGAVERLRALLTVKA
jgi:hypothetical protein